MDAGTWLPIAISSVAVLVALWQGFLAKQQLERARDTQRETERLLDEIREKVSKTEMISDETRKDVKEQVAKLIDKQDENFKVLLNAPKESNQNEMMMSLMPKLLENPEMLASFMSLAEKVQNRRDQSS